MLFIIKKKNGIDKCAKGQKIIKYELDFVNDI